MPSLSSTSPWKSAIDETEENPFVRVMKLQTDFQFVEKFYANTCEGFLSEILANENY